MDWMVFWSGYVQKNGYSLSESSRIVLTEECVKDFPLKRRIYNSHFLKIKWNDLGEFHFFLDNFLYSV